MPMVGYEAEAEQFDRRLVLGFEEHVEEGGVVAGLAEDAHAAIAAVKGVVDDAAGGASGGCGALDESTARGSANGNGGCHSG